MTAAQVRSQNFIKIIRSNVNFQDMTKSLSDILSCLTSPAPPPTPPLPPPPELGELGEFPPGPPSDPYEAPPPPSPPPPQASVSRSQSVMSGASASGQPEELPERPAPPSELIKEMQKKIDIQYKKYPKHEKTPPRPCLPAAPPPPERNNSLGRVKSAPATPVTKRRIVVRALTPSHTALDTDRLKVGGMCNFCVYDY